MRATVLCFVVGCSLAASTTPKFSPEEIKSFNLPPSVRDAEIAAMGKPGPSLMSDDSLKLKAMLNQHLSAGPASLPDGGFPCESFSLGELHEIHLDLAALASPELLDAYTNAGDVLSGHAPRMYVASIPLGPDRRNPEYRSAADLSAQVKLEAIDAAQSPSVSAQLRWHRCHDIAMVWAHHLTSAVRDDLRVLGLRLPLLPTTRFPIALQAGRRLAESKQSCDTSCMGYDPACAVSNVNCVGGWGNWGTCSASCGTGTKYQTYTITTPQEGSGSACPTSNGATNSASCDAGTCPVNCVGSWSGYSGCSASCGSGTQTRTYSVSTSQAGSGSHCPSSNGQQESISCDAGTCPVNCVGSWSGYGSCDKTCGWGSRTRSYSITTPKQGNGNSCPNNHGDQSSENCQDKECPINCVGDWSGYGSCSASCGPGTHSRTYSITTPDQHGGSSCDHSHGHSESKSCQDIVCPVNCVGSFGNYGDCSATCGPGTKTRSYSITTPKEGAGGDCPHSNGEQDTTTCQDIVCPVDCVGAFDGWSTCSKSCNAGEQSRTFKITTTQAGTGSHCDFSDRFVSTRACNQDACPENCIVQPWGDWGTCGHSCGHGATQTRARFVAQPKFGGSACPHAAETRSCNDFECPKNCEVGTWTYGSCSTSCDDKGSRTRTRINKAPTHGGAACPVSTEADQTCADVDMGPCPHHCVVTAFSAWTTCTKSCGAGSQTRSRSIASSAENGGYACPYLEETRDCNQLDCPKNCVVKDFEPWQSCSKSCGKGSMMRHAFHEEPEFGGKACPAYAETRDCNVHDCPSHCVVTPFSVWTPCTKVCGAGLQSRSRSIASSPRNGGYECPYLDETRACNEQSCNDHYDGNDDALVQCPHLTCTPTLEAGSTTHHMVITHTPTAVGVARVQHPHYHHYCSFDDDSSADAPACTCQCLKRDVAHVAAGTTAVVDIQDVQP